MPKDRRTRRRRAAVAAVLLFAGYTTAYVLVRTSGILRFDGRVLEQIEGRWFITGPGRIVADRAKFAGADQIAFAFRPAASLEERVRNAVGWYPKSEVML